MPLVYQQCITLLWLAVVDNRRLNQYDHSITSDGQRLGDTRPPSQMLSPSMADSLIASNGMRYFTLMYQ